MSFAYVKVYHGPCDSFGTVDHKPQKLKGLRDRLQKRSFRVDFVPVDYLNYCLIEMCGHEVFRCNMHHLAFNTPYELDPVCQRAVAAVEEAAIKFKRARGYLWFWTLIEQELFMRSEYAPIDTWTENIHIDSYASCYECIRCCGILCEGGIPEEVKKEIKTQDSKSTKKQVKPKMKIGERIETQGKLTRKHDDNALKFKL